MRLAILNVPMERAPCGCHFGKYGREFLIDPCSESCELYKYALHYVEEVQRRWPVFLNYRPRDVAGPAPTGWGVLPK